MEQKNKQLMIFLAGEMRCKANLLARISGQGFDFYAADGGYLLADQMNLHCKKILGDFDSSPKPDRNDLLLYPSEKDQTDSELALELAEKDGYRDVWMIAPFGGRLDHTVANLSLLEAARKKGICLRLYDGQNLVFLLGEGVHKLVPTCRYISFFPWEQSAEVSLCGFKYPLDHGILLREKPIGISNEAKDASPVITVHRGSVLCICVEEYQEEL